MLVASDTQQPHGVRIRDEKTKVHRENRLGVLFLAFVRPTSTRQRGAGTRSRARCSSGIWRSGWSVLWDELIAAPGGGYQFDFSHSLMSVTAPSCITALGTSAQPQIGLPSGWRDSLSSQPEPNRP